MTKNKLTAFSALLVVALAALIFWQNKIANDLKTENAQLRQQAAELESARDENARLVQSQIDPAELEGLRSVQSEVIRLRGEVSRLRQQLKEAQAASAKRAALSQSTVEAPAEQAASPVETYEATTRGTVGWTQALVTGGWATHAGKRALFFIQPETDETSGQPGQITLQTRIIEAPDEVLAQIGLDALKSDAKQSSSHTVLTREQVEAVIKTLESTPGVNVLSAPRLSTADGRQAQVKVMDSKTINGQQYEVGPTVDIVPRISPDRASVDMTVIARLQLPTSP